MEEVLTKEKQRLSKAFDESKIELESLNSNRKDIEQKVRALELKNYAPTVEQWLEQMSQDK